MNTHYTPEHGENSEEITTEDGKYRYWRTPMNPSPLFVYRWFRRSYQCDCGRKFYSQAEYELHYRKAYQEEKHLAGDDIDKEAISLLKQWHDTFDDDGALDGYTNKDVKQLQKTTYKLCKARGSEIK